MEEGNRFSDITRPLRDQVPIRVSSTSHDIPIRVKQDSQPTRELLPDLNAPTQTADHNSIVHLRLSLQKAAATLKRYPENIVHSLSHSKKISRAQTQRKLTVPLVILLVLSSIGSQVLPFGNVVSYAEKRILTEAQAGWHDAESARDALSQKQFDSAQHKFSTARDHFNEALSLLQQAGQESAVMPHLMPSNSYKTAFGLLQVAVELTHIGEEGVALTESVSGIMQQKHSEKASDDPFGQASWVLQSLLADRSALATHTDAIYQSADRADHILHAYTNGPVGDVHLEEIRKRLWKEMPQLIESASTLKQLMNSLDAIAGADRNRRYLILFLNNTELRPGGGFLGSFATTIIKKGKIDGFNVETNIYKRDETYAKVQHIDSPYPINKINADWLMRDANWDVDFAASAQKIAWFFKQEGGTDVDGVIALDTTVIEHFLRLTGPVEVPKQNMVVDASNVVDILQYKSEKEYLENPEVNALNEPKKAIADAFPHILKSIFSIAETDPENIVSVMGDMVRQKHILLSFFFDQGKELLSHAHLDNPIPHDSDFVMVNNGNLGGLKSSLHMRQQIDIAIEPTDHETLSHTVTITRTHTGSYAWPDGDNHNYLRLVVPKNAIYKESSSNGLENGITESTAIVEQFPHYLTYGHWVTTPVGKTSTARFVYETPIKLSGWSGAYEFQHVKQQGWIEDELSVHFVNANGWIFDLPSNQFDGVLRENALFSAQLENNHWLYGHRFF